MYTFGLSLAISGSSSILESFKFVSENAEILMGTS